MSAQLSVELQSTNGNFVIAQNGAGYLAVNAGEGLDPADPQFTNKIFAHSLLKQGGTLALEDLKLRELTLPLTLKATNKDGLSALVREINTIINTGGCQLLWSDEGTEVITHFSLASGQLDPEFDFRQGQQTAPMLKAKLRLFVQPLGQVGAQPRALLMAGTTAGNGATLTGTPPVLVFHAASGVRGDAPALIEAVHTFAVNGPEQAVAVSVLPESYTPWYPAPTSTGFVHGASEGGSFFIGRGTMSFGPFSQETYAGDQRVLVFLNAASPVKVSVEADYSEYQNAASGANAVTISENPVFGPVDLGVAHVPSAAATFSLHFTTNATMSIMGLVVLPENNTCWTRASTVFFADKGGLTGERLPRVVFSGPRARVLQENLFGQERFDLTGRARGAIPTVAPGSAAPTIAVLGCEPGRRPLIHSVFVNVVERTRYVF